MKRPTETRRGVLRKTGAALAGAGLLTAGVSTATADRGLDEVELTYINVVGSGSATDYKLTVDGEYLRPNPLSRSSLSYQDRINGTEANGSVYGGTDPFLTDGEVDEFVISGAPAEVESGTVGVTTQDVTVIGSGTRERYWFETDGVIIERDGSMNRRDQLEERFSRAEGNVNGGEDRYTILAGTLETGSVYGNARFDVEGDDR